MFPFIIFIGGAILYIAYKTRKVPAPQVYWKSFHEKGTKPLDAQSCNELQGIYLFEEADDFFGNRAVLKWTYTVVNKRTLYHLSFFCEKDGAYIVSEGRRNGNEVLLNGYWRKLNAGETGTVQLVVQGISSTPIGNGQSIVIAGFYGQKEEHPAKPLRLQYQQEIPEKPKLHIIAHRGGARNMDFLAVSENSLDMFRMAARLGATGVEIDVRLTKDNVPVIVHDSFLSMQTFQDTFYGGLVSNYTLSELRKKTLKKGGVVPTLNESLFTILYHTPLNLVWLDIKKECDLKEIRNLQMHYLQKAKEIGRDFEIYIGIPDKKILSCFQNLPDHEQLPSLTELDSPVADQINANVWAPQYTGGFQRDEVKKMQSEGRKVFVWSLDDPFTISMYIKEGGFDGIVTNLCPVAFNTYYTSPELVAGG